MNAKYSKFVRLTFEKGLLVVLPGFKRSRERALPKGYCIYTQQGNAKLNVFCALVLHESENSFTVEVGWSPSDKIPVLSFGGFNRPHRDSELFRLSELWGESDYWWHIDPEETLEEMVAKLSDMEAFLSEPEPKDEGFVVGLVNDSLLKLNKHGKTVLQTALAKFGKT